jgi:hypothetical protein
MTHYYHLDSSGEHTNLQLYSLRQARKYWAELQADYVADREETERLKERCVFILATLGLSISQLLGQNNPSAGKDVPRPIRIFNCFVAAHHLDKKLKKRFKQFNYFYNGCRHFGLTTKGAGYDTIDQLTYDKARECFDFGMEVWRTVVGVYRRQEDSHLDEFDVDDLPEDVNETTEHG